MNRIPAYRAASFIDKMTDSEDDSDSNSKPRSPKPKSTKVNFVLLKQILDDESSEMTDSDEQESNSKENQSKKDNDLEKKSAKEQDCCGPIGRYPVVFSKRCKSKSCQTKLSAFPLFSVPQETEWISEEELDAIPKRERRKSVEKRRKRNPLKEMKSEKKKDKELNEKITDKTKNPDGTRKEFHSEHQLKDTKNPVLQAWIQSKRKLARRAKREERKEKRAQRAAIEEEERLNMEKLDVSEKKVKEWFKSKRKEARKLWRQNHPRISPFDMALEDQTEDSSPPPEYKIVKTFKQRHSSFKSRRSSSVSSKITKDQETDTASSTSRIDNTIENRTIHTSDKSDQPNSSDKPTIKIQRPKTASYTRADVKTKKSLRPKTAKPSTSEDIISKEDSSKQMKSLSYDDWLRSKRELDKKKTIERRKELIDSHLSSVISKLGKQRVENIMSARKHIDTGLKNYSRTIPQSPSPPKELYKWKKAPRPEPQGCDCPEAEHIDSDNKSHLSLSSTSPRRKAVEFCKDVTDKCEQLKPSMDKVLAVLDSEIKKCSSIEKKSDTSKRPSLVSTTNATNNDTQSSSEMLSIPGTVEERESQSRPKSARPKSARPSLVNNTSLTKDEAKKRIFHDMDILGLCNSDENLGNNVSMRAGGNNDAVAMATAENLDKTVTKLQARTDSMSTVRSNYFDYGTDVDVPTMNPS